jgi:hypothetical protein
MNSRDLDESLIRTWIAMRRRLEVSSGVQVRCLLKFSASGSGIAPRLRLPADISLIHNHGLLDINVNGGQMCGQVFANQPSHTLSICPGT